MLLYLAKKKIDLKHPNLEPNLLPQIQDAKQPRRCTRSASGTVFAHRHTASETPRLPLVPNFPTSWQPCAHDFNLPAELPAEQANVKTFQSLGHPSPVSAPFWQVRARQEVSQ